MNTQDRTCYWINISLTEVTSMKLRMSFASLHHKVICILTAYNITLQGNEIDYSVHRFNSIPFKSGQHKIFLKTQPKKTLAALIGRN